MSSNNVAIYVSPAGGDLYFTAGLTAEEHHFGMVDLEDALPTLWKGKYQGHFFEFDKELQMGIEEAGDGITHLALLEGPLGEGEFYFNGETVQHNSLVLNFNADDQSFHYLHCRSCGVSVLKWLQENQVAWKRTAQPAALVA